LIGLTVFAAIRIVQFATTVAGQRMPRNGIRLTKWSPSDELQHPGRCRPALLAIMVPIRELLSFDRESAMKLA
jgi:hypothetical protein